MIFDLLTFSLNLTSGQEKSDFPGFIITSAPKRCERSRLDDILILMVSAVGENGQYPPDLEDEMNRLAHTYFNTPGTVTSGLQQLAGGLNDFLVSCNSQGQRDKPPFLAALNLAVLRKDMLYLAHAGPTHSYIVSKENYEHCQDSQASQPALGLGRSVRLVFFQNLVRSGKILVLCPQPPLGWSSELLSEIHRYSLENVRRHLIQASGGENLRALVFQFQEGNGLVRRLRRRVPGKTAASAEPVTMPEMEGVITEKGAQEESRSVLVTPPAESFTFSQLLGEDKGAKPAPPVAAQVKAQPGGERLKALRGKLASIWLACKEKDLSIRTQIGRIVARLLPGLAEQPLSLSPATLLFIAIAVPVVVVTVATTVYLRNGRSAQFLYNYEQAQLASTRAIAQEDTALQRNAWEQTLKWLDKADEFDQTDGSRELREAANKALDDMDGITRLKMEPAISGTFAVGVQIADMAATGTDVYLLDESEGRVLRMYLLGQGYEVDKDFNCGPGLAGDTTVGPVLDILSLPVHNPFRATVMGIDRQGNLIFCSPGSAPQGKSLTPPDVPWGKISAFTMQFPMLYVMDVDLNSNAVWKYNSPDWEFNSSPRFYFGNQVPTLSDVVDIGISEDDLFLLHEDGRMSLCVSSGYEFAPTTCTDPAPYGDMRQGREHGPFLFANARLVQLQVTRPPDPSVYMLDAKDGTIYHFSLRLMLQRQLRPQSGSDMALPEQPPAAFVITPNRILLLAYQNQVFYAPLP